MAHAYSLALIVPMDQLLNLVFTTLVFSLVGAGEGPMEGRLKWAGKERPRSLPLRSRFGARRR